MANRLNALYPYHPRWVTDTLFARTAQTLSEFAANPRWMGVDGGTPAFSLVLHVLPTGIKRIRRYGVLANACKTDKLQAARACAHQSAPQGSPEHRG